MIIVYKIDSIETENVVLRDKEGQTIVWPKDKLPTGVEIGGELYFDIQSSKDLIGNETKLAENILNEILHTT